MRFGILKCRKSIRNILSKCFVFRRYGAKHITRSPPAIHEPRDRDAVVLEQRALMWQAHSSWQKVTSCGYVFAPARYIVLCIWHWPRHWPQILFFKHLEDFLQEGGGRLLSTGTMESILLVQTMHSAICSRNNSPNTVSLKQPIAGLTHRLLLSGEFGRSVQWGSSNCC